jgi:hypothetical protein
VRRRRLGLGLVGSFLALGACAGPTKPPPTPTVDPGIHNQVPTTTVFEPGQCQVVLREPAPSYTSSTLGGAPSGEIPPGTYEVGVAAQYASSLWYALNTDAAANYIQSTSAASTRGDCAVGP